MSLNWEINLPCNVTSAEFFSAIEIWVNKPQIINKRLWGTHTLHKFQISNIDTIFPFEMISFQGINEANILCKEKCVKLIEDKVSVKIMSDKIDNCNASILIVKHLPRVGSSFCVYQIIITNYVKMEVFFSEINTGVKHNLGPRFAYSFHHNKDGITLKGYDSVLESGAEWLKETLFPQIIKWAQDTEVHSTKHTLCSGSLNLIDNNAYHSKYNELKIKYGKEMVKIWPECTDPAKFVYEDIGIATYLLLLWESERKRLGSSGAQSFVDLGCGNGLLVYLLTSEGHQGFGVDVRKRQIWDMYPPHVVLKEQTISPSDVHLFPEADWIIGNHSDELTPWVPVIAARSSYRCNFFLLPCCCYNFNGTKYQRKNSSKSQYTEYLEHIHNLCKECGFKTNFDKLKIPSTKRTCLIGTDRSYTKEEFSNMCNKIQNIIAEDNKVKGSEWIDDFKPREGTEKVRNCTQVDKTTINSIVDIVSKSLMKDCNGDTWSLGRTMKLSEVVDIIPDDLLNALKSECGGLQTLLRNHHQIFRVERGDVQLRYPQTVSQVEEVKKNRKKSKINVCVKKKLCWFYNNHPQGCPLSDHDCSFIHTTTE